MHAACWSRQPGRRLGRQVRCGLSSCGSEPGAVSIWRPSQPPASLPSFVWHLLTKGESYVWARPSLHAKKLRDLELKAGHKPNRGQKGAAHAYNVKRHRDEERRWVEQAETAYTRFVAGWNPRGPKKARTGAADEERR